MGHIRIAPSILSADFTRLGEQVRDAEAAGADLIHIDVMDGRFVPNITMGALVVQAVRRVTSLPLDVHLMIIEPDHLLKSFAEAGAQRISVHWEACPNLHRTLQHIRELGVQSGIAINPHTPALLLEDVLHMADAVLVMTVNPGFGGQQFLPETLPKISALREMAAARQQSLDITVDGGIHTETAPRVITAGATTFVAGSSVFNSSASIEQNMAALRQASLEVDEPTV